MSAFCEVNQYMRGVGVEIFPRGERLRSVNFLRWFDLNLISQLKSRQTLIAIYQILS